MVDTVNNLQKDMTVKYADRPRVNAPPFDGVELLDGFVNGVIDVFPEDSLFDLCRDNTTAIDDIVTTLSDLSFPDDNLEITEQISDLLKFPYGFTFSCYFAVSGVFWSDEDPEADGELTEEEALNKSVIFVNDITTNILFNLGYMYNDVKDYTLLEPDDSNYWKKIGNYSGDFFIRIFWRESFATVFEY